MFVTSSPVTSSAHLHLESRWLSDGAVHVAVIGEIDLATTEVLRAGLLGVIFTGPPHDIDVDLAGVTFLDCGGLSALVIVRQAAARAGCRLRITGPRPIVRRVLEITGCLGILTSAHSAPAVAGSGACRDARVTALPEVVNRMDVSTVTGVHATSESG